MMSLRTASRLTLTILLASSFAAAATSPGYILDALEAQTTLSQQHPADASILNDLGNLQVMAGKLDEAEATYQRAVELQPDDPTIRYNLALVLMELGDSKGAMAELLAVIETAPDHAWAYYQLGTLEARKHNRMRALDYYAHALALDWNLASPSVNPHIVENRLATDAMLRAYLSESPASAAPRLYQQPEDVAALLVPMPEPEVLEPMPDEDATPVPSSAASEGREADQAESFVVEDDRVLTESDLEGRTVSSTNREQPRQRTRPRKSRSSPKKETDTSDSYDDTETTNTTAQPTRQPTRQPRTPAGSGVTGVVGVPVVPGSGTLTQPSGVGSTGRLDLELLPLLPSEQIETPT